jgi:RimJ/RimL family protein N-acetyltransferase
MLSDRGIAPLKYRRLATCEFDQVLRLDFSPDQVERFLGPLNEIVDAVRRGPSHQLVGIDETDELVGFFAIHPDQRDGACWWLGWFGIDRRRQGGGRGKRAIDAILARLRQLPACREVRLLVAPENAAARRLYQRAGFALHGVWRRTGELIMRCVLPLSRPSGEVPARFWANAILLEVVDARKCRMGVPVAAQLHGEVAFPP